MVFNQNTDTNTGDTPGWANSFVPTTYPTVNLLTFADLRNKSTYEFVDISSEEYRTYSFKTGGHLVITNPIALSVSSSGHRVLDAWGNSYYIGNTDWNYISWKVKGNTPHFVK